jgi:hypothetical protein
MASVRAPASAPLAVSGQLVGRQSVRMPCWNPHLGGPAEFALGGSGHIAGIAGPLLRGVWLSRRESTCR